MQATQEANSELQDELSEVQQARQAVAGQLAKTEAEIESATAAGDAANQKLHEAKSAYLKATEVHWISLAPEWNASDSKHMSDTTHGMQCTDTMSISL